MIKNAKTVPTASQTNAVTQMVEVVGMDCASCANIISRKLKKIDGVESCEINFGTEKAEVSFDPTKTSFEAMNTEIKKLGYSLLPNQKASPHHDHGSDHSSHIEPVTSDQTTKQRKLQELAEQKLAVLASLPMVLISSVVMAWEVFSMTFGLVPEMPEALMEFFHHLLPIMATYMLFVVGVPYLQAMVRFARYRVANMDTLVGIGTSVAFLYSFIVTAFESTLGDYINTTQNYYDVTIVVIGFIALGKYLESRSKLQTGAAIEALLGLQAKTALVERDGVQVEIPLDQVVVGDKVFVKPGQKIPVDGKILEGASAIDESMITGESIPVDKNVGDTVIGGTINKQGSLKVVTTQVGKDTVLAQIITMVEQAQGSKAPIERLVDQVSAIFVPVVLVFAVVVLALWLVVGSQFMPLPEAIRVGLLTFVGILVIACPCAMGLATPTAVIVGVGKAAENGILIKNAESLEKFSSITYMVMDKTGTLTKGQPEVTDLHVSTEGKKAKLSENAALQILASLEHHSEHPLAQAIVAAAKQQKLRLDTVTDFAALEGKGVTGKIGKQVYTAGNLRLAAENGVSIDQATISTFTKQGKTPIILMQDGAALAYVAVADTIKPDAKQVVQALHQRNIKVAMLTGDNQQTAEYIAAQIGIDTVIAEVLPTDKAAKVSALQQEGYKVAMIGDGINDAPALATADVGVAMGNGTDVAIESAGITLLGGSIGQLPKAVIIARATMNTIKQNLFWAFFYNVVGIPIAAGLLYPFFGILLNPVIAGGAMAFSSVSVVLNALRLKSRKLWK